MQLQRIYFTEAWRETIRITMEKMGTVYSLPLEQSSLRLTILKIMRDIPSRSYE